MARVVIDLSALVAFLQDGDGAAEVERALVQALHKRQPVLICATTWGELRVMLSRRYSPDTALRKLTQLEQMGILVESIDRKVSDVAATIAVKYGAPHAECLALALAMVKKGTLLTTEKSLRHAPRVCLITHREEEASQVAV
jgi:uncharacterized protein with PIN domain